MYKRKTVKVEELERLRNELSYEEELAYKQAKHGSMFDDGYYEGLTQAVYLLDVFMEEHNLAITD